MNRRTILKNLGSGAALALLAPSLSFAQQVVSSETASLGVSSLIENNHGHEVILDEVQVIELLRETKLSGAPTVLNIQGQSRHPHSLSLSHEDFLLLLVDGSIQKTSSTDSSHSHGVTIRFEISAQV